MGNGMMVAPEAGKFIDQHSLSPALDVIGTTVRVTYQHVERVAVELQEDPEVEDFECLVVTLRVRGSIAELLESERKTKGLLRRRLRAEDYRKFALTYEIPA